MCSYNAETYGAGVLGPSAAPGQAGAVPSCANRGLLTELARETWGFDGYVTSDCWAVDNVQNQHHYTNATADTVAVVLEAGMDIDCGKARRGEERLGRRGRVWGRGPRRGAQWGAGAEPRRVWVW